VQKSGDNLGRGLGWSGAVGLSGGGWVKSGEKNSCQYQAVVAIADWREQYWRRAIGYEYVAEASWAGGCKIQVIIWAEGWVGRAPWVMLGAGGSSRAGERVWVQKVCDSLGVGAGWSGSVGLSGGGAGVVERRELSRSSRAGERVWVKKSGENKERVKVGRTYDEWRVGQVG